MIIFQTKKTFANAGLRLNYIETFDTFNIEPRIQALQKLNKYFSFKIAGEFKDPTTILDLISTEMSKQTKTITLKLNDKTKDR